MPILTLTSDIGSPDYLVAAIKARLMQINGAFSIVDISHNITPFNYPQTVYVCRSAFPHFPDYTIHLLLTNLFEKRPIQLLLAFYQNQYLLCADNGLLTMIMEKPPDLLLGIPLDPSLPKDILHIAAAMGQTANQLAAGEPLQQIGNADVSYMEIKPLQPSSDERLLEGQIIFIDTFENVIVNITKQQFEEKRKGRRFRIDFARGEYIDHISETYADVQEGEKLAMFNSAGYLEIAVNKGNAAGLFGLKGFSEKITQNLISYRTVKVYFEQDA